MSEAATVFCFIVKSLVKLLVPNHSNHADNNLTLETLMLGVYLPSGRLNVYHHDVSRRKRMIDVIQHNLSTD